MKEKPNIRNLLLFLVIFFVIGFLLFSIEINWFFKLVLLAFGSYFIADSLGLVGKGKYQFPKEL